jgi:hypothetical protein
MYAHYMSVAQVFSVDIRGVMGTQFFCFEKVPSSIFLRILWRALSAPQRLEIACQRGRKKSSSQDCWSGISVEHPAVHSRRKRRRSFFVDFKRVLAAMAEVDSSRHFPNNFPDFDPTHPDPSITAGSSLSPAFVKLLRRHRNRLLKQHFREYSRITDDDCSVYTGQFRVYFLFFDMLEPILRLSNLQLQRQRCM